MLIDASGALGLRAWWLHGDRSRWDEIPIQLWDTDKTS